MSYPLIEKILLPLGCVLAMGAMPSAHAKDASVASGLAISGKWTLLPDLSTGAKDAADLLLPARGPHGEGERPPMPGGGPGGGPGREPGGGPGGGAGGWGGMGGGGRGGFGGGGFGRGGPGGGYGRGLGGPDMRPPTEEERAAMRLAIEMALGNPTTLEVQQTSADVTFIYPEGRSRKFTLDGKKSDVSRVISTARIKEGQLIIETQAGRSKIQETWLRDAQGLLTVAVRAESPRYKGAIQLTREFRKTE
ncbi:MAG: hypothetical protein MUF51_03010 [Vicinamibacteria bacterium]|jgi:hypothetical protein|nr:hypothetical protein [Vicinamibacteria bacterium]